MSSASLDLEFVFVHFNPDLRASALREDAESLRRYVVWRFVSWWTTGLRPRDTSGRGGSASTVEQSPFHVRVPNSLRRPATPPPAAPPWSLPPPPLCDSHQARLHLAVSAAVPRPPFRDLCSRSRAWDGEDVVPHGITWWRPAIGAPAR